MTDDRRDPLAIAFELELGFKSSGDRIVGERDRRIEKSKRQMPYQHAFLDDCLRSIMPHDLILIGAETGVGKTELARSIAMRNAFEGKRVHYFALEAEPDEIEMRGKYTELMKLAISKLPPDIFEKLNYSDWYRGRVDADVRFLEYEAEQKFAEKYKTLKTYYRGSKFDYETINKLFLAIQDETDLIILDHLHYVDVADDNENRGLRSAVMAIRNVSLLIGRPVILVVHLRKRDMRTKSLVPSLGDVHGSSDITKVCTHAIMLARAPRSAIDYTRAGYFNTFFSVPKDRVAGATDCVALCLFDWKKRGYSESYTLGRAGKGGDVFEPMGTSEVPQWARRHEAITYPQIGEA